MSSVSDLPGKLGPVVLDPAQNIFTQPIDHLWGGHHLDRDTLSPAR